jgi:hypothetical protein
MTRIEAIVHLMNNPDDVLESTTDVCGFERCGGYPTLSVKDGYVVYDGKFDPAIICNDKSNWRIKENG